ncbi:MAG: protease complex subunit PrcB family protein [Nitrospinota bacterium]
MLVVLAGNANSCMVADAISFLPAKEWKGYYSAYTEPLKLVIKTEEQWKEVWTKVHALQFPEPELPKIDFEKDMIIAVFMGERRSGGFSIEIKNIVKTDKEVVVEVEERRPDPGSIVTMALTRPYHMLVVKTSSLPLRFQYL